VPRLVAEGLLPRTGAGAGAGWGASLTRGVVAVRGGVVRLWTGLLVRPREGVWLRLSGSANRRNRLLDVDETFFAEERFVPLVVDFTVHPARGPLRIQGEIATLAPLAPETAIDPCALADAPEIGRAHAEFYDHAYFDTKKKRVGAKYRGLVKIPCDPSVPSAAPPVRCRMVNAGPVPFDVTTPARFLGADTPRPARAAPCGRALARIVHRNAVSFRARFDGHVVVVEHDERALAAAARAIERTFAGTYGPEFIDAHRGALWFFTKYFTRHPPGEPHFFLKLPSFTVTPRGWSALVDGIPGDGFDVLRGVIATDVFHAAPAVFALHHTGRWIDVPAGTPLVQITPFPRSLALRPFHEVRWS
jgi:hypothetical protein